MITKAIWEFLVFNSENIYYKRYDFWEIFFAILASVFTIPIDILLTIIFSPILIITFIVKKILESREKNEL